MRIGVIGAGSWGLALAGLLIDNEHEVKVWSRNSNEVAEINEKHELKRYLPGIKFSEKLKAYIDMEEVVKATEMIILAVPSVAVRDCSRKLKSYLDNQIVVNVAKGIEAESLKRLSQVIFEEIGSDNEIAILSGPSHAEEVAKRMPTVVAVAAEKEEQVRAIAMYYPALCVADNWNKAYPFIEDIPETTLLWDMALGKQYFMAIRDFKVYEHICSFEEPVLVIHGDEDEIVPLEYSKQVVDKYKNAKLVVLSGEGHGYTKEGGTVAMEKVLKFFSQH